MIRVVRDLSQWKLMGDEWNLLLSRSQSPSVFMTYEWMSSWWEIYGSHKKLHIVLCEEEGKIYGIGPFYTIDRLFLGFRYSELRFLGDQYVGSDMLDCIALKGRENEFYRELYQYLDQDDSFDIVLLDDLSPQSYGFSRRTKKYARHSTRKFPCPCMKLPPTYEAFMARPDIAFKKFVNKEYERIKKHHHVESGRVTRCDEMDSILARMYEIHSQRWQALGKRGSFQGHKKRKFYLAVAERLHEKGMLELSFLKIDGVVEAVRFAMTYQNKYFALQGGISPNGLKLKAGNVLELCNFRELCGLIDEFHYLRGAENYKYQWGCQDIYTQRILMGRGWFGRMRLLLEGIRFLRKEGVRRLSELIRRRVSRSKKYSPRYPHDRWIRLQKGDKPAAVILGSTVNALSFVRSLDRRGIKVLMLDGDYHLGIYTRLAKKIIHAHYEDRPEKWLELLTLIGRDLDQKGVLFVTSDFWAVFLAKYAKKLSEFFYFDTAELNGIEKIVNKRLQYTLAENIGISIPKTFYPYRDSELELWQDQIPFPCILKPYKSHIGKKVIGGKAILTQSLQELIVEFRKIHNTGVYFMVQDVVPGDALFVYQAYWDRDGNEQAWMVHRKTRQYPRDFGNGSYLVTVDCPEVIDLSRRLVRALKYQGITGVEFKMDPRDGLYRLIEMNPRSLLGNELTVAAGLDFPWLAYRRLTGTPGESESKEYRKGVTCVHEVLDFKAYLERRSRGELSFIRWLRGVIQADAKSVGSWRDPLPFCMALLVMVKAAFRHFFKKTDHADQSKFET